MQQHPEHNNGTNPLMDQRLIQVVSLWLKERDVAAFESFEHRVIQVLAKHGGRIERAVRTAANPDDPTLPFEVHLVSFPSRASYDAYRQDTETVNLRTERGRIIGKTVISEGYDITY